MTVYGPLAEVAVVATMAIVVASMLLSTVHPAIINVVVTLAVLAAVVVYSLLMGLSICDVPLHLFHIVFDSTNARLALLSFWALNVIASIAFAVFVQSRGHSTTLHRKFFHLTVSLVYMSGLFFDLDFVWLCGWLMICFFVIVETLRFYEVPPWNVPLNKFLLVFKDEQDSKVLLTPIFLLTGVFLPLFLSPNDKQPHLYHLAGVAAVGVGDSVAAIIGSQYGKTKWPRGKKTVEGSLAMAVAIAAFLLAMRPFCSAPHLSSVNIVFAAVVLAAIEAITSNIDNIILPIIGFFLL